MATGLGLALIGLPAILLAALIFWRRQRPIFWFAIALIAIGLAYLGISGAGADIGRKLLGL